MEASGAGAPPSAHLWRPARGTTWRRAAAASVLGRFTAAAPAGRAAMLRGCGLPPMCIEGVWMALKDRTGGLAGTANPRQLWLGNKLARVRPRVETRGKAPAALNKASLNLMGTSVVNVACQRPRGPTDA